MGVTGVWELFRGKQRGSSQVTEWRRYYLRWDRGRGTSLLNQTIPIQSPNIPEDQTLWAGFLDVLLCQDILPETQLKSTLVKGSPFLSWTRCCLDRLLSIQVKEDSHVWNIWAGDKGGPGREWHYLGNNAKMWGGDIDRGFRQGDGEAPQTSGANGDLGARNEEFQKVQCANSKFSKARLLGLVVN